MATSIVSTVSGNTSTYVITDQQGNACTVVANPTNGPNAGGCSFNMTTGTYLLIDGQTLLSTLILQLQTGLRPTFNTNSFT
jgi:hypothetical protein